MTLIHHVEYWLANPAKELPAWRWLLSELGLTLSAQWEGGESWQEPGGPYLTLTACPHTVGAVHNRRLPGVNHLAFVAGVPARVDELMSAAGSHGWSQLYAERYPHAGGEQHYAGWLENAAGYKVELVAAAETK
ncbi:MAG: glyoxalase [Buchananella hordeovulneris]|nr:glyoxalase [Buchananella hordeovulneris]